MPTLEARTEHMVVTFDGSLYDWGLPLIPSDLLTSLVLVGLEKGCTTGTCIDKDIKFNAAERSVVWVTPMSEHQTIR
jgi:hypothetical protein